MFHLSGSGTYGKSALCACLVPSSRLGDVVRTVLGGHGEEVQGVGIS